MSSYLKTYCVIATYNAEKWLKKCLNSLKDSSYDLKTIVVDNASSDATLNIIETDFPEVIVLKQSENLGFGKSNNIGISYALKHQAQYVFLLNQDAYIEKNTLEHLINIAQKNPEYGILSPIHLNWEGTHLEYYFARFAAKQEEFLNDYVLQRSLKTIYEVPFVNAAAWLIHRNVLTSVGGFDPIFYHYGEDNNFTQRARYHGFKIGIVPNTFIRHDSPKRKLNYGQLFDDEYYRIETNQFKLNFANILKDYNIEGIKKQKKRIINLIIINILKLKWSNVMGYIKKYKIFGQAITQIKESRKINIEKAPHYLDI